LPRLLFRATARNVGNGFSGSVSPEGLFLFRVRTPPQRKEFPVSPETLAAYAGTYVNAQDPKSSALETVLTVDNNRLMMKRQKQESPLTGESETYFFSRTADADRDFEFVKDGQGKVTHFIEYSNSTGVKWIRK
jgi:hypothetical protein